MRVPLAAGEKTSHRLKAMDVLQPAGMRGRAPLHMITPAAPSRGSASSQNASPAYSR